MNKSIAKASKETAVAAVLVSVGDYATEACLINYSDNDAVQLSKTASRNLITMFVLSFDLLILYGKLNVCTRL